MDEEIDTVDGIAVRSEKIEFGVSQLLPCDRCRRANAPNRAECIYCGAPMAAVGSLSELKLREVEPWEKAFNIVLMGGHLSAELAPLPIDAEVIRRAAEHRPPTPVVRTATREAAEAVRAKLQESGFQAAVLSDEDLAAERPPARLRSLLMNGGRFEVTAFNTGEKIEFPAYSLELIVIGRLFEERVEQTLARSRKGVKELDARNVTKDTCVVDLYFTGAKNGFRILESGFDFSCLGGGKSLIASENMTKLVDMMTKTATHAAVSSDYVSKRNLLDEVWPSQTRNDSKGIQRSRFSVSLAKAEVTSNTEQFTKYSRLVRQAI